MKKTVIISLTLLLFCVHSVYGWGVTGHRTTGWIADKYLSKKARKKLERILNGQSLAILSTWMDEVKSDSTFDYMEEWHWVTVPYGVPYEKTEKNPKGDIVQTLDRIIAELKSGKLTEAQQLFNIRILIHLVGDIHQPLHVGGRDDKGGNDIRLTWFGRQTNLHRVWDSDMIDDTRLSYTELGQSLETPAEAQITQWQKHTVLDWAYESQSYEKQVYDIGDGKLGYEYSYKHYHIVRKRLLQAGVRLAGILNDVYGK